MIWHDDDKRADSQKKQEYARELDRQIELRRALDEEEKQQNDEWDQRFVFAKDTKSPAKWWSDVDAGVANSSRNSINRFGFQMDKSALPSAATAMHGDGENSGAMSSGAAGSASYQRFRNPIDPLSTQDRLREKAQQLEWRHVLDEQVREKERRQQQEAEEKRQREEADAYEEMRLARERQLRAQRKLGLVDAGGITSMPEFVPQNYVAIPSPPAPPRALHTEPPLLDYEPYSRLSQETVPWTQQVMPPPAPMQTRANGSVDYNFRQAMGLTDHPQVEPRDHVVDEYRSLLMEIRREREELRNEREELRQEKEELRMERALMQMENEKMATLLESQRQMNEQRFETMARLDRDLDVRRTTTAELQMRSPRPTRLPSPLHIARGEHTHVQHTPAAQRSMAALAVGRRARASPVHQKQRETRPGAMSMADFAAPPSNHFRSPANAINSSRIRRLGRFQLREQQEEDEANPLEQSLTGESHFVALSPPLRHAFYGDDETAPRITETNSPAASRYDPKQRATGGGENVLRNSRVIKSRGFYDVNRPDAVPTQRQAHTSTREADQYSPLRVQASPPPSQEMRHSSRLSVSSMQKAYHERVYGHRSPGSPSRGDGSADEHDEDQHESDDDASDQQSEPELSRSLFQVQVLVNE